MTYHRSIDAGWWYTYPSEKYEFVSWDDSSHILWTIKAMFETTNQGFKMIYRSTLW
jgi:hypothetical protein